MLLSLSIRNFILIDELDLEFEKGLCTITGETGSGKSILLEAILFCLGNKNSSDIMKPSTDSTSVTAVFSFSAELFHILNEIGIECEDEIIIKRVQSQGNRKKFLINDQIVTQKTIDQLANCLFEIHGQNNHTALLNPSVHIDILDNYGSLHPTRAAVAEIFKNLQNIKRKISEAAREKEKVEREIDYLSFVVKELSEANIKAEDEEILSNIRRNLQGRDKEIQVVQDLTNQLELPELDNIINKALRVVNRSGKETQEFLLLSKNLDDAYDNIEEARQTLHKMMNDFTSGEHNLEQIEERLFEIRNLARKYNVPANQLPDFLTKSQEQLSELEQKITDNEKLLGDFHETESQYLESASFLSRQRVKTATDLEKKVQAELAPLKMERAIFKVDINSSHENAAASGIDKVLFLASTNPGQPFAPINVVASGGELSRFMLAFKSALFDKTAVLTIIFDEVDTGIGGAVAEAVGERLKKLSKLAQVIVITHQPQVASKADQHILVKKIQLENQTSISVLTLSKIDRAKEIARMISGKIITEAGVKAAKELLVTGGVNFLK